MSGVMRGVCVSILVYIQVIAGASASPIKKWLFEKAMASKNAELRR